MREKERVGLLTDKQLKVLQLRRIGKKYSEIAQELGVSIESVFITEKRALRNIKVAFDTIKAAVHGGVIYRMEFKAGTKLMEVPVKLIEEADRLGIKINANFTKIYDDLRYEVPGAVSGTSISKDIAAYILFDGSVYFIEKELEEKEG